MPGRDVFGFFQILSYLPVYLTLFVVATLHLGGAAVVGLGLGLTVVLGCICALALLWDHRGQVALGVVFVSVTGAFLLVYGRG